ncbi:hypothetical protein FB384_003376 [Prauserella sediminis]|uniref:Uncharacterized protein n=1 Tax=Prauserella sediminis TaxID=577680 RepID=A0A839XKN2_9PSEU|nr:hypothetical protein [Prauserella sediminis]
MRVVPEKPFEAAVEADVLVIMSVAIMAGVALTFMWGSHVTRFRELGRRRGVRRRLGMDYRRCGCPARGASWSSAFERRDDRPSNGSRT